MADVGRLLVLMRSLVADARFARSAQLTMTEWSAFFARLVNVYLAGDTDSEERALSQCLQQIEQLRSFDVSGRVVGYRIACESLRHALKGLTGAQGSLPGRRSRGLATPGDEVAAVSRGFPLRAGRGTISGR